MKKLILFIQLILLAICVNAQPIGNPTTTLAVRGSMTIDSLVLVPTYNDTPAAGRVRRQGSIIRVKKLVGDTVLYSFSGNKWGIIGSSSLSPLDTPVIAHRVFIEGQSNAYGVAAISDIAALKIQFDFNQIFERIYISDSLGGYHRLQMKVNNHYGDVRAGIDTTTFGLEMALAWEIYKKCPTGVYLIDKRGYQGAGITLFMGSAYDNYLSAKRDSSDRWCRANGYTPVDEGWIWVQGESNSTMTKSQYQPLLDSVINVRARRGIFNYGTRRVLSQISKVSTGYGSGVDSAFIAEYALNKYNRLVNNDSNMSVGNIHYNAYQMLQLGANAFSAIYASDSGSISADTAADQVGTINTIQKITGVNGSGKKVLGDSRITDDGSHIGISGSANVSYANTLNGSTVVAGNLEVLSNSNFRVGNGNIKIGSSTKAFTITFDSVTNGASFFTTGALPINIGGGASGDINLNSDVKGAKLDLSQYVRTTSGGQSTTMQANVIESSGTLGINYTSGLPIRVAGPFYFDNGFGSNFYARTSAIGTHLIESTDGTPIKINSLSANGVDLGGAVNVLSKIYVGNPGTSSLKDSAMRRDPSTGELVMFILPKTGNATLSSGTITITDANVASGSEVSVNYKTISGTPGTLSYVLSAGTSFTINSTSVLDNSVVSYSIKY